VSPNPPRFLTGGSESGYGSGGGAPIPTDPPDDEQSSLRQSDPALEDLDAVDENAVDVHAVDENAVDENGDAFDAPRPNDPFLRHSKPFRAWGAARDEPGSSIWQRFREWLGALFRKKPSDSVEAPDESAPTLSSEYGAPSARPSYDDLDAPWGESYPLEEAAARRRSSERPSLEDFQAPWDGGFDHEPVDHESAPPTAPSPEPPSLEAPWGEPFASPTEPETTEQSPAESPQSTDSDPLWDEPRVAPTASAPVEPIASADVEHVWSPPTDDDSAAAAPEPPKRQGLLARLFSRKPKAGLSDPPTVPEWTPLAGAGALLDERASEREPAIADFATDVAMSRAPTVDDFADQPTVDGFADQPAVDDFADRSAVDAPIEASIEVAPADDAGAPVDVEAPRSVEERVDDPGEDAFGFGVAAAAETPEEEVLDEPVFVPVAPPPKRQSFISRLFRRKPKEEEVEAETAFDRAIAEYEASEALKAAEALREPETLEAPPLAADESSAVDDYSEPLITGSPSTDHSAEDAATLAKLLGGLPAPVVDDELRADAPTERIPAVDDFQELDAGETALPFVAEEPASDEAVLPFVAVVEESITYIEPAGDVAADEPPGVAEEIDAEVSIDESGDLAIEESTELVETIESAEEPSDEESLDELAPPEAKPPGFFARLFRRFSRSKDEDETEYEDADEDEATEDDAAAATDDSAVAVVEESYEETLTVEPAAVDESDPDLRWARPAETPMATVEIEPPAPPAADAETTQPFPAFRDARDDFDPEETQEAQPALDSRTTEKFEAPDFLDDGAKTDEFEVVPGAPEEGAEPQGFFARLFGRKKAAADAAAAPAEGEAAAVAAGQTMAEPLGKSPFVLAKFRTFYNEIIRDKHQKSDVISGFATAIVSAAPTEMADPEFAAQLLSKRLSEMLELQAAESNWTGGDAVKYYPEAQYAMVALADETFATIDWPGKSSWPKYLLEPRMYGSRNAEVEFFSRIDRLLKDPHPPKGARDLARVYLLVIASGFRGKFRVPGVKRPLAEYRRRLYEFSHRTDPLELYAKDRKIFPEAAENTLASRAVGRFSSAQKWMAAVIILTALYMGISHFAWIRLSADLKDVMSRIETSTRQAGGTP
jgi:type IV/VI secretion system ImpK/VasF family protein